MPLSTEETRAYLAVCRHILTTPHPGAPTNPRFHAGLAYVFPDGQRAAGFSLYPNGDRQHPNPTVFVYRESGPHGAERDKGHPEGANVAELHDLTHEVGHMTSWKRGHRTVAYEDALDRFNNGETLDRQEKLLILDEETRAWDFGREILVEENYSNLAGYDRAKEIGLADYLKRLDHPAA